MLQPNSLPLITFTFIIFCSWWTLNCVVSDPQTNLVAESCSPSYVAVLSNFSIYSENVNETFRSIRGLLLNQNRLFATAEKSNPENQVFTLFQCRSYLSVHDCVACFDAAARHVRGCPAESQGRRVIYDGCFLRYETSSNFFGQTTENFNAVSCGNQSARQSTPLFTSLVQQVLMNLQTSTPQKQGFFGATKAQLPATNSSSSSSSSNGNGASTIYGFAQCIETITQSGCEDCLKACYSNMQICLPNSDGKAYAAGCFMRYSASSFFPDNWAIAQILQTSSSNKKSSEGIIIGGVVAAVSLALIFIALFALIIRRRENHKITITLRGKQLKKASTKLSSTTSDL